MNFSFLSFQLLTRRQARKNLKGEQPRLGLVLRKGLIHGEHRNGVSDAIVTRNKRVARYHFLVLPLDEVGSKDRFAVCRGENLQNLCFVSFGALKRFSRRFDECRYSVSGLRPTGLI